MRLPACGLAVLLSLVPVAAQTTPSTPPPSSLTLEQCVAEALAKNFTVRISAFSKDSAAAQVIIAQSTYDPVLGVQWQEIANRSPDTSYEILSNGSVAAENPYTNSQQASISASENLITGGQVTAGYNLIRGTSVPQELFLNPDYDGNLSLNVSQPLLQGAGIAYARATIESARLGERIAGLNLKTSVLALIFNVETAYYNVIETQRQYAVAEDTLKLAQQLLDENTIKRRTGVLTDLDVVQAQAGVATAKSQLIGFRQAMENSEDTLLQALGERTFETPVGALALGPPPDTNVSFDYSYKLARDNGPSLAIVAATIEQYRLSALQAKRNALPKLSVNGGGGYLTDQTSYGTALSHTFAGPGYNWQAGLNLSFPWGLRQNKALYRQAMDNMRSEQATLDQTDQTLTVQLRAAVRSVNANQEAVEAADESVRLSDKQYELQKAKFDAGLATSYDVLQAQDQLETARVTQIQADVNIRIAVADLHFLEGTSIDRYKVNLKP